MMPREKWTDERLDGEFARFDGDIRELRGDLKDLRSEMNARFDKVDERFEALNRILIGSAAMIIAALIGLNAFFESPAAEGDPAQA